MAASDLAFLHNIDRDEYPNPVLIIRDILFAAARISSEMSFGLELQVDSIPASGNFFGAARGA